MASHPASDVPSLRVQVANQAPVQPDGEFVLYWMVANRRLSCNFSLQRAVDWAQELGRPLLIFEPLRINYRWASDRLHQFIMQGMAEHRRALQDGNVRYYPYVEPEHQAARGLFESLAAWACVVVTDDYPCFFLPTLLRVAARVCPVRLEAIDSNGLLPLRAAGKDYPTAYSFRRFLQKSLPEHLAHFPKCNPLPADLPAATVPREILDRWPEATEALLSGGTNRLSELDIDHSVPPVAASGGAKAASQRLSDFLKQRIDRYAGGRNHPDEPVSSGLSPYLHFGQISAHEVFQSVVERGEWSIDDLQTTSRGRREGWWGLSPGAESFLDELITWRELGYNMCAHRDDYHRYESLPDWAQKSLAKHADDPREFIYELDEFEQARTHDPLWNAAQQQLLREGIIHNYLRMLWGKKVLEWTSSPQQALEIMIELNNKYAIDGRDPNSYSGIFWVLGRYDRAWGPERPIYGKVRYMTSQSAERKLKLAGYLETYGSDSADE